MPGRVKSAAMAQTWWDYRAVWSSYPWLLVYAILVVVVFVAAIVGTFIGGPLAILFIPSLAGVYVHHLLAMKRVARDTEGS
jgi:hypothetical protein